MPHGLDFYALPQSEYHVRAVDKGHGKLGTTVYNGLTAATVLAQ